MVVVNRRHSSKQEVYNYYNRNDGFVGGISGYNGTGSNNNNRSYSSVYASSSLSQYSKNPYLKYNSYVQQQQQQQHQLYVGSNNQIRRILYGTIVIAFIVCSWMIAYQNTQPEQITIQQLEEKLINASDHVQHIIDNIRTIRNKILSEKKQMKQSIETQRLLSESSESSESANSIESDNNNNNSNNNNDDGNNNNDRKNDRTRTITEQKRTIQKWMNQRQTKLVKEIETLQSYLQASSRRIVEETYGLGPHRVRITIERNNNSTETDILIIKLASIDIMPSSVHYFLDLVHNNFYDDTVLIHHENVDHIIAIPPISYTTRQSKLDTTTIQSSSSSTIIHDRSTISYPEYSNQLEHNQYTIGFSNQGPTFYINTKNNTRVHGPGGQKHHLLSNEADPCFGHIIHGYEVVDTMIHQGKTKRQQQQQNNTTTTTAHVDLSTTWTRLIKAEII